MTELLQWSRKVLKTMLTHLTVYPGDTQLFGGTNPFINVRHYILPYQYYLWIIFEEVSRCFVIPRYWVKNASLNCKTALNGFTRFMKALIFKRN